MKHAKKEYLLEIDYASYMLAIELVRHTVDQENLNHQWTGENLSVEMNKLQWGNTANFGVDYVALKHGMHLFSSELKRRGVTCVTMFHADKSLVPYYSFEAHHRSIEVKFTSHYCPPVLQDTELLDTIRQVRDEILKKSNYPTSIHQSPSSVLGSLLFKPYKNPFYVEPPVKSLLSKSPDKLGARTLRNNRDKLINNADDSFGKRHSIFYLESALKKVKYRQSSQDKTTNKEIVVEDNNHIDLMAENDICDDIRIKNALNELPCKNVIFSEDDQSNVLILYNIVRKVVIERDYEDHDNVAADLTEEILETKNIIQRYHPEQFIDGTYHVVKK